MQDSKLDPQNDVGAALDAILRKIAKAARACGRDPAEIALTAVSKTQTWDRIAPALAAGQRGFGENRVQEALGRWTEPRDAYPDLELRLIGPLQTNKAETAVGFFDVIETLDREKLAVALAEAGAKLGKTPRVLIQVNTGEEPQKAGVSPRDASQLIRAAQQVYHLGVEGLMCIPPVGEPAGPHFALLAKIAAAHGLKTLSMGMSDDYPTAIRFGATHVRVGSALFGRRALAPQPE